MINTLASPTDPFSPTSMMSQVIGFSNNFKNSTFVFNEKLSGQVISHDIDGESKRMTSIQSPCKKYSKLEHMLFQKTERQKNNVTKAQT